MQSGVISILLREKSNVENKVKNLFNILIKTAKSFDKKIANIESLEEWEILKIYKISLMQYLGNGKIELFCLKIKLSTKINLKTQTS